jgi:hypothetical protein
MPNVYLSLPNAQSSGIFRDKAKAQKELDGYIGLCSQSVSLDGLFLNLIQQIGTPEQLTWTAATVRKRLETDPRETRTTPWERLWSLEFKANPVSDHPAVRKRIGEDLAGFEKSPRRREVSFMEFLKSGYGSLGDQAPADRLNEEILTVHPQSAEKNGSSNSGGGTSIHIPAKVTGRHWKPIAGPLWQPRGSGTRDGRPIP